MDHTDLTVFPGHKIGVIGANGSGKSTLFEILRGRLATDTGECRIPSGWQIALMAQEIAAEPGNALDFVLGGDAELAEINDKLASQRFEGDALARLFERLDEIDGFTAPARAEQLLNGLGFKPGDGARLVNAFSGGWRIRLNLARALMCRSDLLLLDEPTNHLDLDACLWLEKWLQSYPGTLVVISHDRDFLDNIVGGIVSFENQKLVFYTGNYSAYERMKAARLAEQEAARAKQQARVGEIEDFVRRFRAKASKAKQAQSRLKELERMEIIAPAHVDSPFDFRFRSPEKIPQQLLTLTEVSAGYPERTIFEKVNLSIHGDTRVALIGANGAGKTTLIKLLADQMAPLSGDRIEGAHLKVGYFAQHQLEALDAKASCYLHLARLDPKASEQSIRNFLGGFDFQGDRAFEPIEHFSGGEKARLALAVVTWQRPNLLLLDEPTNHLDIEMRQALTMALQGFEGALVVISHDRHLIRNTVEQFWLVDDGSVREFDGDLADYHRYVSEKPTPKKPAKTSAGGEPSRKPAAAVDKDREKSLRKQQRGFEQEMTKLGQKLQELDAQLADENLYRDKASELPALVALQGKLRTALAQAEEQWLAVTEQLES